MIEISDGINTIFTQKKMILNIIETGKKRISIIMLFTFSSILSL
jgi:hypothetical protein